MLLLLQTTISAPINCSVVISQGQSGAFTSQRRKGSLAGLSISQEVNLLANKTKQSTISSSEGSRISGVGASVTPTQSCSIQIVQGQSSGGIVVRRVGSLILSGVAVRVDCVMQPIVLLQLLQPTNSTLAEVSFTPDISPYIDYLFENKKNTNELKKGFIERMLKEKSAEFWISRQREIIESSHRNTLDLIRKESNTIKNL